MRRPMAAFGFAPPRPQFVSFTSPPPVLRRRQKPFPVFGMQAISTAMAIKFSIPPEEGARHLSAFFFTCNLIRVTTKQVGPAPRRPGGVTPLLTTFAKRNHRPAGKDYIRGKDT
ncbi:hypothetical protein M0657_010779 [Pyricularia oryzae]|nr:hypothetical protein M0657_010779 [Pyricularia oryzae]